mmetsp:Transcript_100220/g.283826  ORF Transcript_100220/g.283826 Transcript_100220/m.283826 type:complete len:256 (+) Transcript_100220:3-770(+)
MPEERARCRDYLGWLLQQRDGKVVVDVQGRSDVTEVELPDGADWPASHKLREIEQESGTFVVVAEDPEGSQRLLICGHDAGSLHLDTGRAKAERLVGELLRGGRSGNSWKGGWGENNWKGGRSWKSNGGWHSETGGKGGRSGGGRGGRSGHGNGERRWQGARATSAWSSTARQESRARTPPRKRQNTGGSPADGPFARAARLARPALLAVSQAQAGRSGADDPPTPPWRKPKSQAWGGQAARPNRGRGGEDWRSR